MDSLISYIKLISIPFAAIWFVIFQLPDELHIISLFCQFFAFIITRDSMVPTGLWTITNDLDMHFINSPKILSVISALCLMDLVLMHFVNRKRYPISLVKVGNTTFGAVAIGACTSLVIFLPVMLYRQFTSHVNDVVYDMPYLLGTLALCLCGNLVEEVLYRSYLADYLRSQKVAPIQSMLIQAYMFTILHCYLAFIVTDVGIMILLFTMYEGFICAYVEAYYGVLASAIAHGLAIFCISVF